MASFLERYLKKSSSEDITYQGFIHFFQQGVEEHQTLEYKPHRGKAVAKYVTCICTVLSDSYEIMQSNWQKLSEGRWQFATGFNNVVYPDIPFDTGNMEFRPLPNSGTGFLNLQFGLYAEGMTGKVFHASVDPKIFTQQPGAVTPQNEQ